MNNPVNLVSQKHKVRHQQGFASLLFVLLIGLSLVIIVLGVFLSLRGLQDSTITSHAQTQAEEKTMIGVKALSKFLYSLDSTKIAALTSGTITDKNGTLTGTANSTVATYAKSATCPTGAVTQYCFDVTASSGGASATIRTVYQKASTLSSTTLTGSVFAGGLIESGNAIQFTGNTSTNPVTISTGGAHAGQVCADNTCGSFISADDLLKKGIKVTVYQPTTFISADDLKPYSNYQFTASVSSGTATLTCKKLNIHYQTDSSCPSFSTLGISYTYSNSNKTWSWSISDPALLPVGVLWFDTDVSINLSTDTPLVNTIISTGSLTANTSKQGVYYAFSPYYFYKSYSAYPTTLTASAALLKVCGSTASGNIPTQYCNPDGTFNETAVGGFPGSIANILFLTNSALTLNAANSQATLNFFGNMIASYGAGGTGSPSGNFIGSGNINITGNLVISGTATTTLSGSMNIDLTDSTASSSSVIPSYTYANSLRFIKYM
ncbi:hypothetical protein [Acinetobacter sp. ANC 4639]